VRLEVYTAVIVEITVRLEVLTAGSLAIAMRLGVLTMVTGNYRETKGSHIRDWRLP
jgi:hypothetical protein